MRRASNSRRHVYANTKSAHVYFVNRREPKKRKKKKKLATTSGKQTSLLLLLLLLLMTLIKDQSVVCYTILATNKDRRSVRTIVIILLNNQRQSQHTHTHTTTPTTRHRLWKFLSFLAIYIIVDWPLTHIHTEMALDRSVCDYMHNAHARAVLHDTLVTSMNNVGAMAIFFDENPFPCEKALPCVNIHVLDVQKRIDANCKVVWDVVMTIAERRCRALAQWIRRFRTVESIKSMAPHASMDMDVDEDEHIAQHTCDYDGGDKETDVIMHDPVFRISSTGSHSSSSVCSYAYSSDHSDNMSCVNSEEHDNNEDEDDIKTLDTENVSMFDAGRDDERMMLHCMYAMAIALYAVTVDVVRAQYDSYKQDIPVSFSDLQRRIRNMLSVWLHIGVLHEKDIACIFQLFADSAIMGARVHIYDYAYLPTIDDRYCMEYVQHVDGAATAGACHCCHGIETIPLVHVVCSDKILRASSDVAQWQLDQSMCAEEDRVVYSALCSWHREFETYTRRCTTRADLNKCAAALCHAVHTGDANNSNTGNTESDDTRSSHVGKSLYELRLAVINRTFCRAVSIAATTSMTGDEEEEEEEEEEASVNRCSAENSTRWTSEFQTRLTAALDPMTDDFKRNTSTKDIIDALLTHTNHQRQRGPHNIALRQCKKELSSAIIGQIDTMLSVHYPSLRSSMMYASAFAAVSALHVEPDEGIDRYIEEYTRVCVDMCAQEPVALSAFDRVPSIHGVLSAYMTWQFVRWQHRIVQLPVLPLIS
jgi:hypothetical protein